MILPDRIEHYLAEAQPWIAHWGIWIVAGGIFCETVLLASVAVPGFSILICAGYLCGQGQMSLPATIAMAWIGGVLGDQSAYALGWHFSHRFFARRGRLLRKLRAGLLAQGPAMLLWYHFVAPMRIVVPYTAGSIRYPFPQWALLDSSGLLLWICFAVGVGYFSAGPLRQLGNTGYWIILIAGVAWFLYFTVRLIMSLLKREVDEELDALEDNPGLQPIIRTPLPGDGDEEVHSA